LVNTFHSAMIMSKPRTTPPPPRRGLLTDVEVSFMELVFRSAGVGKDG
jgi:hypothetical protein